MSSIQTAERRLVAAEAEAAAAKVRLVKAAEAEGESTRIQAAARAEGNYLSVGCTEVFPTSRSSV
jgi:regulator of protease activity HflC (stomatin/prohibitin superfamily)